MKLSSFIASAVAAFTLFVCTSARGDTMASLAIAPTTGAVTLTPRWAIGGNLAGFHQKSQNLGLTGSSANNFYSLKGTTIPAGGDILAFNFYAPGSGAATPHADIGSKLTPDSYSALTSADPDVGFGSVNLYTIHHKGTTDYFTAIIPGSGTASAVTDEKPMSGPGGPGTVTGVSGYFGLTFAAGNLGYGINNFYYLRTDPVSGNTKFGTLAPALLSSSSDQFDLGTGGHKALTYTGTDVGYGVDKMYYLRLDPVTGFTILGLLDPALAGIRHTSDIANLGSVFSTLTFVPGDVGFGANNFYATGAINPTWQSVSFAAIADRTIASGSFTVSPTASSALPIVLTVVPGSTGSATITGPVGGVFTVTPTAPGVITLQATQAGAVAPIAYESNMLRQSFTVTGVATSAPTITNSPLASAGTVNAPYSFTIAASQSPTSYSASPLPPGLVLNPSTGAITGTPTTSGVTSVLLGATNSFGTGNATLVITVAAAGVAPVITNNPLTAAGTAGAPFTYAIVATGLPTSYGAAGLPAGLSINGSTGIISGTPTAAGVSFVSISATNANGTGGAVLTITTAAAGGSGGGGAPIGFPFITNTTVAAGTLGKAFNFAVIAAGSPSVFSATGLADGLVINPGTGAITGLPTKAGQTVAILSATNSVGTATAALVITIGPSTSAPTFTSPTTAPATAGTPFVTYLIAATGAPTSYAATGLPPGLTLNSLTGAINGTPTTAGTYLVVLTATNVNGTSTSTLTITVAPTTVAPIITSPGSAPGTVGTPFITYLIAATGLPTTYTATGLPAGLTLNALTGAITGTPTASGTFNVTLTAANTAGTSTATLTIVVAPAAVAPIITSPTTAPGATGTPFVTYVIAGTGLPTSYTATGLPPGLTLNPLTGAINGTPTTPGTYVVAITATNTTGTSTATVTMVIAGPSSRIVNFSARALSGPGSQTLIVGFVVAGNNKNLLVRGIGPTLASFGVTNPLADPLLTLFDANNTLATNDDWQTSSTGQAQGAVIAATAAQVGAFPLPNGSKDSALLLTVNNGAHTTSMLRPNGTTGVALTEIYDIDTLLGARLINVSARMNVTPAEGTLIAGFVISGNAPKTVLIRGVGPTLGLFGVTGLLADPQINVFSGGTLIAANDDWSTGPSPAAQIAAAAAQVGAFALPDGSKDAALLLTLQPGAYTVVVTGAGGASGVALVEIYDVL
jgi:PKD repeat protein